MSLLLLSVLAGMLTVLAPCILPLLPVVIGGGVSRSRLTPYVVIGSLAISIFIFTFLLKVSTVFISVPPVTWAYLSGIVLIVVGTLLIFPQAWSRLSFVSKANHQAHQALGQGYQKKSLWGDVIIGASLGPIFSTCSPTYFVILGTILPASLWQGTVYLTAYILGLVFVLVLITLLGQKFINKLSLAASDRIKKLAGVVVILVGIFVISGYDKKLQTWVLDNGVFDISRLEQRLLDDIEAKQNADRSSVNIRNHNLPPHLLQKFPQTDFSKFDPNLSRALSGGPGKDGIPALTNPTMEPIINFATNNNVQVMILEGQTETKVYPYNILTWHEIVNDTIDGVPVLVTFCPLCGSAIAFRRELINGNVLEFGVSGSLLESNMIMYDRSTESLWQQSTGRSLAGSYHPNQLELFPFQLMNMDEARNRHPNAVVLSENTGHQRDYTRNPYIGYETNDQFYFRPSYLDDRFDAKEIMVVFRFGDQPYAIPWLPLREVRALETSVGGQPIRFTVTTDGQLEISDGVTVYPFYFEMWFSYAVQHGAEAAVIDVAKTQ